VFVCMCVERVCVGECGRTCCGIQPGCVHSSYLNLYHVACFNPTSTILFSHLCLLNMNLFHSFIILSILHSLIS
jgi:hypothetical protein